METNERGEQMVLDSLSGAESRGEVVEAGGNEEKILASVETKGRGRAKQKVLDSLSDAEVSWDAVEAGRNEEKILASVETKGRGRAEQKVLASLSVSTGELVILSCEDEVTALFGGTDSKEATTDRDKKEEFLEKKVVLT